MRVEHTSKWPNLVEQVTFNSNHSYHRKLGNLRPIDLNSRTKAVALDQEIGIPTETPFREFAKNKALYKKTGDLKVNDWVYLMVPHTNPPPRVGQYQV